MSTSPPSSPPKPPYRLYGVILAAFLAVRFLDLATRDMDWTVWVYESTMWRALLALVALASSYFAALWLRTRVPGLMAWLLAGLCGAVAMLLVNSGWGAGIGLVFGGLALRTVPENTGAERPSWWRSALRPGLALVPLLGVGTLTAAVMFYGFLWFGQRSHVTEVASVAIALVAGFVLWIRVQGQVARPPSKLAWSAASLCFLAIVLMSFVGTVALDSAVRRGRATRLSYSTVPIGSTFLSAAPWPRVRWLERRLDTIGRDLYVSALYFNEGSSDADVSLARGFPFLIHLCCEEGSELSNAGLARLNKRYLRWFHCAAGTQLDDGAVQQLPMQNLESLELLGPNFTDASLAELDDAPCLQYLALPGTAITAAGLRQLDPLAPLWYLDLSGTQLGDGIWAKIGRHKTLRLVNLSGCNVTGSGLAALRGLQVRIDLSDTPFDLAHLEVCLPPPGEQPLGANEVMLNGLALRNLTLDISDLQRLAKLPYLADLDLLGATMPEGALQELGKLKSLGQLHLDVQYLLAGDMQQLPQEPSLAVGFDARRGTIAELTETLRELEARPGTLMPTDANDRRDTQLVIRGLAPDGVDLALLTELEGNYEIRFWGTTLPDGRVLKYATLGGIKHLWQEQTPPASDTAD